MELNDFYNSGCGWVCSACEREFADTDRQTLPRVWREGEAESKHPTLANHALAKWTDKTRRALTCPRCGLTESIERS